MTRFLAPGHQFFIEIGYTRHLQTYYVGMTACIYRRHGFTYRTRSRHDLALSRRFHRYFRVFTQARSRSPTQRLGLKNIRDNGSDGQPLFLCFYDEQGAGSMVQGPGSRIQGPRSSLQGPGTCTQTDRHRDGSGHRHRHEHRHRHKQFVMG